MSSARSLFGSSAKYRSMRSSQVSARLLHRHLGYEPARHLGGEIKRAAPRLGHGLIALFGELPLRFLDHGARLLVGFRLARAHQLRRLLRGGLHRLGSLLIDLGALCRDLGELRLCLLFGGLGIGELLIDLAPAPIDQPQDRPIEKAMEQPDEDGKVDRLKRK